MAAEEMDITMAPTEEIKEKFVIKTFPITRMDRTDVEEFKSEYLQGRKPLILTGFAKNWPAFNWTLHNLKEMAGENVINVRRNTNIEDYKVGQKYNIEKMKFAEYINNITQNNKKSKSSYMAVQNIKQAFPQLEDQIHVPEFVEKMHAGPFLWIANKGHYEFCHFDPDDNCLVVLNGRKKVMLFGSDLNSMYPNKLGSKGRTIQSQVCIDEPDLKRFPNFQHAKCFEVGLNLAIKLNSLESIYSSMIKKSFKIILKGFKQGYMLAFVKS